MLEKTKENREQRVRRVRALLTTGESYAYDYFLAANQHSLSPELNAKLYQLFLCGKTTEEMRRLNQVLTLGQIVAARIEGDWDRRRDEYLEHLLDTTTDRVEQATLETADFVCDLLAVAGKEHGDRLKRYLQTNNPEDLGSFKIDSIFGLKQAIETLQKLTGQERQRKIQIEDVQTPQEPESEPEPKEAKSEVGRVLKLLAGKP